MSVKDEERADMPNIEAFANHLLTVMKEHIAAGKLNNYEGFLALLHATAIVLSNNADPVQRAEICAKVLASFPEIVRKYGLVREATHAEPPPTKKGLS